MKKILCIPFLMFALVVANLQAQTKTEETKTTTNPDGTVTKTNSVVITKSEDITVRENMINVNPLKFFVFYNLTYYRLINKNITIGAGVQTPTLGDVTGFGVNAELRFHPSGKGMRGFYVAPNFTYNSLSLSDVSGSATSYSIGALLGWQWFPGDDFSMGLGIGMDRYFLSSSDSDLNYYSSYKGNVPALRFDIGYAW